MDHDSRYDDLTFFDDFDDDLWADERELPRALDLAPAQRAELAAAVQDGLRRDGCDNTLRAAQQWASRAGVPWARLREQLTDNGGYCDCEVLFNVLDAEVEDESAEDETSEDEPD